MEIGGAEDIYGNPSHPYTQGLISSVPTLRVDKTLSFIPGEVPSLINPPPGCRFHPRCPFYKDRDYLRGLCDDKEPPMIELKGNASRRHLVACWLYK